ncbi:Uncharacterised protein [Corynebacterium cystitidis]|nr:Uncharacterised protein [Corynebacterium cystitidis]
MSDGESKTMSPLFRQWPFIEADTRDHLCDSSDQSPLFRQWPFIEAVHAQTRYARVPGSPLFRQWPFIEAFRTFPARRPPQRRHCFGSGLSLRPGNTPLLVPPAVVATVSAVAFH